MDYGYQLLRHIVQQVFGNLQQAARLTLLLYLGPYLFLILGGGLSVTTPEAGEGINIVMVLIGLLLMVICYCWAAVVWHRYVLLEEMSGSFVPPWQGQLIGRYFRAAFKILLIVVAAILLVMVPIGAIAAAGSGAIATFLFTGIAIGISWLATRIGLILPAAALGEAMPIRESWRTTAPVSAQILVPVIVIAIVTAILNGVIGLAFGVSTISVVISGLVSWIQVLVNLALMTTLYGNLVQGRALN